MDLVELLTGWGPWALGIAFVTALLVSGAKLIPWVYRNRKRAAPVLSLGLGLVFAATLRLVGVVSWDVAEILRIGLTAGGAAIVGFDLIKGWLKKAGITLPDCFNGSVMVLLAMPLLFAGCAAPLTVREAQAFEEAALIAYARNAGRIHDLALALYETERARAIEYTTAKTIEKIQGTAVDGKLPAGEFAGALKTVIEERDKAQAQTAAIKSKVRDLMVINDGELKKALRLHGSIAEWLEAGIDESAIPGLSQEVMSLVEEFRKEGAP